MTMKTFVCTLFASYHIILHYAHCRLISYPLRGLQNTDGCVNSFNYEKCAYEAYCESRININDGEMTQSRPECTNWLYCNNGYNYLPLILFYKSSTQNVEINLYSHGLKCSLITLDLSFNDYQFMPNIIELKNLQLLNVSHNVIDIAKLYNYNELSSLKDIDFSYNKIKEIQMDEDKFVYKRLKNLWLSHNEIIDIPENVFHILGELEFLDLSYNRIANLSQSTFEGIKKLQNLELSNNEIVDINSSLFRFTKLKKLYLNNNKIENVLVRDFGRLNDLETLDLSHNRIKALEKNVFKDVCYLKKIDFSFNLLTVIDKNIFSPIINLQSVDISKNEITELPMQLFLNQSISYFSVKENNIEGPLIRGTFEGLKLNTKLDLSYQSITAIEDYAFFGLDNLLELLLNNNLIKTLSNKSFKTLQKLVRLDVSFNEITQIEFDKQDLLSLQSMILHGNHITKIQKNYFNNLQTLQFLDLSYNNISQIETQSFKTLVNVNNLLISKNPLSNNLESNIFEGLNSVPLLDLSFTRLNIVKNYSFDSMFELYALNISHSKICEVQYNSFSNAGNINIIDLSYNEIKTFNVNKTHLSNLQQLILNDNHIKILADDFIKGILLNKIVLSNNFIEFIDEKHFEDQKHLRYVDLSYNSNININFSFIKDAKGLETLILSGSPKNTSFKTIGDTSLTKLIFSHSYIQNVSLLNLSVMNNLQYLKLNDNNISRLEVGAFSNLTKINEIDVSYNNINVIQPGIFQDNHVMKILNISHNALLELSYGVLHGLLNLNILDISYNSISSLETERFFEVVMLKKLIADHNRITDVSVEDFRGIFLEVLSIGDNPLPCHTIVNFKKNSGSSFTITAARNVNIQEENVYGITCNMNSDKKYLSTSVKENSRTSILSSNENILMEIRDILLNLKDKKISENDKSADSKNIFNFTQLLENSHLDDMNKLDNLNNVTLQLNEEQKDTNKLLDRILKVVVATTQQNRKPNESLRSDKVNITSENFINIINKMQQNFDNSMILDKEKIVAEIEGKLLLLNRRIDLLFTTTPASKLKNEKLILSAESKQSIFVETCVALILFIAVCLVLFKIYKSRQHILRRRSITISTRQIADAMDTSNV